MDRMISAIFFDLKCLNIYLKKQARFISLLFYGERVTNRLVAFFKILSKKF